MIEECGCSRKKSAMKVCMMLEVGCRRRMRMRGVEEGKSA